MKKNLLSCVLSAALILTVSAGCSTAGEPPVPTHTHTPLEGWDRNAAEHWHICACGEKLDSAAHALDDMSVCTVCGSEIIDWGDGTFDVYNYDETGAITRSSSFSKGGELLQEYLYEREYDADGNPTSEQVLLDGVLCSEVRYTTDENGTWQTGYTDYYDDGSQLMAEYDPDGNIIHSQQHDPNGLMVSEIFSEYAYDDNGDSYEINCTSVYADGTKWYTESNQYGDITLRRSWTADGTPALDESYEYGYDDAGERMWVREYKSGALTFEILNYAEASDDEGTYWRYPENTVEYFENGTKMAIFYGPDTEPAIKTWYNAEGEVVHELTFTNEYDDEGNLSRILAYDEGVLVLESEYIMGSNGFTYLARETEYRPNGTRMVWEYDEDENLISETEYGKG